MKKTWRLWVDGGFYEFKSFRVYWAYRWWLAEQIEKKIVKETKGAFGGVIRTVEHKEGLYSNAYKIAAENNV